MQKLQISVFKYQGAYRLCLVRHPRHLGDLSLGAAEGVAILSPPLSSTAAYKSLGIWQGRFRGRWSRLWWALALRQTHAKGWTVKAQAAEGQERVFDVLDRLRQLLEGRLLSEQRLMRLLRQEGFWPSDISRALDLGVQRSELRQVPGFVQGSWGRLICSRCQSEEAQAFPCMVCGSGDCLLCLECRSMGEHRSCSVLFSLQASPRPAGPRPVELSLTYTLTEPQKQASQALRQFWLRGEGKALVWAACGAGKTEVTFAVIRDVLQGGGEVLFAIPRQDIVKEMADRLRRAFPHVQVAAHYSGQPWLAPGPLVVATTHQVLHFHRRFHLAILDEVDAFPYQGNEMLRLGLERALQPQGKLVEMTATPQAQREYGQIITIPARYHGFALPEPELVAWALPPWSVLQAEDFPAFLLDRLGGAGHPWLIFAPTISACSALHKVLAEVTDKSVGLCHSKVPDRAEVVRDFRENRLEMVVSTSVLERGVNFPGVGVMVLYADHSVFSVSTLVQMAGRVGRTADSPRGTVIFAAARIAWPMKKSLQLIRHLNDQAKERGLLFNEGTA